MIQQTGIRSLVEFGRTPVPRVHPELYPRLSFYEAAPKCISGRTSYYRTRLAFHSYPQVIRDFFNRHRFGPPPRFTGASTCSWIDRAASGSSLETRRPLQTRFPCGSGPYTDLNLATNDDSPAHFTKGTPSPSAFSRTFPAPIACRHTGSGLFTPRQGCFSPFPLGTVSLSVACSIQPWTMVGPVSTGISRAPAYSGSTNRESSRFRLRGFHPLRHAFPIHFD